MLKKTTIALALCAMTVPALAQPTLSAMQQKVKTAMQSDIRTDAEKQRDKNRAPIQALEFFGLKENMKVIEFAPGGGWYTKILGPVLAEKGELLLAYNGDWMKRLDAFLTKPGFESTKKLAIDLGWNGHFEFNSTSLGVDDADMLLNIREYHNFDEKGKVKFNKAAFDALKPGGVYVIVDHTRRHMAPETEELGRREDPVKVILEVQAAGFVLEKQSDMFYRPDDELRYEVGRKTVTGNTDRFALVFRKPK